MIRRPATTITVQSSDVEELKRYRAMRAEERADAEAMAAHADASSSRHQQHHTDGDAQQGDEANAAGVNEHPADVAARERRQRSARERIGVA